MTEVEGVHLEKKKEEKKEKKQQQHLSHFLSVSFHSVCSQRAFSDPNISLQTINKVFLSVVNRTACSGSVRGEAWGTRSLLNPFLHHHVSACSLQKGAMRLRSSVAWTGLVIVLLTKQRTTALSPSDKKKKKKKKKK